MRGERVSLWLVAVAAGVAAAMTSPVSAQNVLLNPGFEDAADTGGGPKPLDWGYWDNTWSVDNTDPNATLAPIEGSRMEVVMSPGS